MTTTRNRVLLLVVVLLVTVGTIDAAIGRVWDLAVVCGAAALAALLLLVGDLAARTPVPLRTDLVRWLEHVAADGDERPADVADRAIAAYRAGLTGSVDGTATNREDRGVHR